MERTEKQKPGAAGTAPGPTYSVLIVDDDESVRSATRRLFRVMRTGAVFEAFEAASGSEAFEFLGRQCVDCVLLDHEMPGGYGVDWISRLLEACPYTAVILVTGAGNEEIAVEAMKRGAMDYLVKSQISVAEMHDAIANAVEKVRMREKIAVQEQMLREGEKHRVMLESVGAACHHLGQPMTIILTSIELLRRQDLPPTSREIVDRCVEAAHQMQETLDRLQHVSSYRTEPYLPGAPETESSGDRILSI